MTRALLLTAMLLLAFATVERAQAISRAEDLVRDLSATYNAPTTFPPNPALRPYPQGDNGDERTIMPVGPDMGPSPQEPLELLPARAYPFLVAIVENDRPPQEGYICAGTRIAPNWVVTAAHCTFAWVRRWPVESRPFVLFDTLYLSQPGPKVAVRKIIPHPAYDPRTLRNDIALLRIDTQGQDFGPPLQLEGPPIKSQLGQIAFIGGWGVTNLSLAQRQKSETQQILQAAVRGESCFSMGNFARLKGTGVFCASSLLRHHDICYRFGGGPLMLRDPKGVRYLAGIVSWPAHCSPDAERMNAYLDIQSFVPWIKSVIQANGGGGG